MERFDEHFDERHERQQRLSQHALRLGSSRESVDSHVEHDADTIDNLGWVAEHEFADER